MHLRGYIEDPSRADIHGYLDMVAEWVRDLAASAALWDDEQLRAELQATTAAWDAWLNIAAHAALCIVDEWYPLSGLAGEALPVGDNAGSDHDEADAFDAQSYTSPGEEGLDDEADTLDTLSTSPGWTDPELDGPDLPETQLESDSMQRQATYRDVKADAFDAMSCISPGEQEPESPDDCHDLLELDRSESKGKTEGLIIQEFREAEAAQTPPRTKRDAAKDGPHFLDVGNISNLKLFYTNSLKCHIFIDVRFLCGHVYDFEAGCDFAR